MQQVADILTSGYFTAISALVIISLPRLFRDKFDSPSLQNICVSAGILGTFLGIFGGLLEFNLDDVGQSIPSLLGGLKTAFLTSIAGSIAALIVKIKPSVYGIGGDAKAAVDEEVNELTLIRTELEQIRKNLSGDGETTILTQLQKMRVAMTDKQEELNAAFRKFAEKMVQDNRQSLIEALTSVIQDFNTQLTTQFGENFKELNVAVGRLLDWQERYKEQLAVASDMLAASATSLQSSSSAFELSSKMVEEYKELANGAREEIKALSELVGGLKGLSQSLSGSADQIKREMQEITGKSIEQLGGNLKAISETLVNDYAALQQRISQIAKG